MTVRCGWRLELVDHRITAATWRSRPSENPIAIYTAVRFYHPGVHMLSWLYFATLFWILPISLVGTVTFLPVFTAAMVAAGIFQRCLLWLRDALKRRLSNLAPSTRDRQTDALGGTVAILLAVQVPHYDAATSLHAAVDTNSTSVPRATTFHLVAVGVLKCIADQALPTIVLVLTIQTALNYVVLAFYSGGCISSEIIGGQQSSRSNSIPAVSIASGTQSRRSMIQCLTWFMSAPRSPT